MTHDDRDRGPAGPGDGPYDVPGHGDVRDLLERAVSRVEPHGGLDRIRERTRTVERVRRRRWALGGVAAAVAATVAAVLVLGGLPGTPDRGPDPAATSPSPTGRLVLPVFFLGDTPSGPRLFAERHRGDGVEDALALALAGDAFDADYRSRWPAGTALDEFVTGPGSTDAVHLSGNGDLTARPPGLSAAAAEMSVQQLVRTAEADTDGRSVRFRVAGRLVDRLLGVDVSAPVPAAADDDVMAPVLVDNLSDRMRERGLPPLESPFTVRGRAMAFEANVQWELMAGDRVVRRGFTTARECCTLSPYSFTVSAPPGDYTLVVHDEDASGEGRPVSEDTKAIIVR